MKAVGLRIVVGRDAHFIDSMIREDPDHAYDEEFLARFAAEAGVSWALTGTTLKKAQRT
jgi:hypothetical protein